jgi:hypothetical protein
MDMLMKYGLLIGISLFLTLSVGASAEELSLDPHIYRAHFMTTTYSEQASGLIPAKAKVWLVFFKEKSADVPVWTAHFFSAVELVGKQPKFFDVVLKGDHLNSLRGTRKLKDAQVKTYRLSVRSINTDGSLDIDLFTEVLMFHHPLTREKVPYIYYKEKDLSYHLE